MENQMESTITVLFPSCMSINTGVYVNQSGTSLATLRLFIFYDGY